MREIDTSEDNSRETHRRLRRELVRVRLCVRVSNCVCVHMRVCVYICVRVRESMSMRDINTREDERRETHRRPKKARATVRKF